MQALAPIQVLAFLRLPSKLQACEQTLRFRAPEMCRASQNENQRRRALEQPRRGDRTVPVQLEGVACHPQRQDLQHSSSHMDWWVDSMTIVFLTSSARVADRVGPKYVGYRNPEGTIDRHVCSLLDS